MEIPGGKKRVGLAAIVVEFVLIAVTLIAAIILGGFVFGTIGIYVPPAEVAAQVNICTHNGNVLDCVLTLANQGTKGVSTVGVCTLDAGQGSFNGTVVGGGQVPAGGVLNEVSCSGTSGNMTSNALITGSISLTDGAMAYFTSRIG